MSITGLIGDDIEVPLQLQEDMSLRLILPASLVPDIQLLLRHERADKAYSIGLGEF